MIDVTINVVTDIIIVIITAPIVVVITIITLNGTAIRYHYHC